MNTVIPFRAQPPIDAYELALQLLKLVLPPEGVYFAGVKTKRGAWKDTHHSTIEPLCAHLFEADRAGGDAYFAVASFSSNADGRKAENVRALRAFRIDIDYGEGHRSKDIYKDAREALTALEDFRDAVGLPEPMISLSGGGLHIFWPLKYAIGASEWKQHSEGLKTACLKHGLRADHGLTANAAGVLRLPGTTNRKIPGKPRPVTLNPLYLRIEPYDLAQFEVLLGFAPQRKTAKALSPLPPKPTYLDDFKVDPKAFPDHYELVDVDALAAECGAVAEFQRTGDICEPAWMRHALLFHYIENGEALFHEYSARNYPRYDQRQAREKWDRAGAANLTGPPLCSGFRDSTDGKTREICLACPHLGAIITPLHAAETPEAEALASADTAATAATGAKRGALVWELTQGGRKKPKSYRNTMLAVDKLNITGRYDTFHDHKIVSGDLIENLGDELSDQIVRAVRKRIVIRFDFDPGKDIVRDVLDRLCESTRFDPVRDYLDGLKWDGAPRLDRWLIDYLGAEDTELNQAFGRKTLTAAVRRARQPGCKFDYLLVLEGPQGAFKSTALRILAGDDNFSDARIIWNDPKQQRETTRGVWIHELSELVGLHKAEQEAVKSFLSRQDDFGRSAYDHLPTRQPRHCIHIGTSNGGKHAGYWPDPTGARRLWPVQIDTIALPKIKDNRDQLWAEAAFWEAKGEELTIPADLYEAARIQQEMRGVHDPWTEALERVEVHPSKSARGGSGGCRRQNCWGVT
jgi:Virulence-associated protein E